MATKHFMTGPFSSSSSDYAGGYDDQTSSAGSSSNYLLRQHYEVFLSFSGDDTRYGFTDHLYHRLVDRGIEVFRESKSLHVDRKIDQLLEAIMASKILVPIISTHYASSEWCLKELLQIIKCNKLSAHLVLPIFYKVKPSDVGDQKGQFGEEFQWFKEKHREDIKLVHELEQAFKDIVSLKGWESDKFADGHEGKLVKAVVTRIFNELRKPILDVPEYLVGVEEQVKEIMKMFDTKQSNDAKIIAIHGMGGIGKTTLAKALYNELSDHFDSCSFVPNIHGASSKYKGMEDLQKKVISDVLVDKSLQEISHVDEGIAIMEKSFKGKKLLLLLDDVDDKDQLKKLAVKRNLFGSDSIVIITTRNKDVTKASAVNLSYELNELDGDQSYELFCKHAFGRDASCPSNLEHIARGIVFTTGGLPLAIEIIGSLLYQKSESFWSITLKKLRRIPNSKVLDNLILSYEALEYEQQQIFLDIACLPIGNMRAFYMWDACGFYSEEGIQILISKSLINIRDHIIVMNDQLRYLGREIIRREGRDNIGLCSRLWLQEEAIKVIERKQGTPNIQALCLSTPRGSEIHFTSQQFEGMENLRFLHMGSGVHLTGDFENLFSNITWLSWRSESNYIDIMGFNFNPIKLVILELKRTNITEHWKGWNQIKNLRVLILEHCNDLTTTPDFSAVEGLEELVLHDCYSLEKVHPSIGKFRKTLKVLAVQGCSKLEELPVEVREMAGKHFMTSHFSNSSGDYAGGYDDQMSGVGLSSNPPLKQNYEVFLSFSGDDTRYGFTDHLYHRLVDSGIEVFRDSKSLHVDRKIDQPLEAIMASKILVPIISTHYASSEGCLKELLQILKCNKPPAQLVIPIFYKVKPYDVLDQKGQFGEEFQWFKEKHHEDIKLVYELEQAFKDIVSLKGWESDKFADGHEGELVKAAVTRIFNELRKPILDVPEYLVGVEEHVKEIMKMLDTKQSNDAKIIAIHGMGGIGKTTLAKVLYNELFDHFDSRSFVPNIRGASSKYKGMEDLQKRVISDVLVDKSLQEISHVDEGIAIMEKSFKGKKLLLLLDDVDDKDQLKKLAVKRNLFGSDSVVIITTRNKDVTKASAVNLSYELNELDGDQSYELFCKHAFGRDASCPSNLEHIARGIVFTTGGLPLAIEIIGSLLYQKSESFWSITLKKLRRIPNSKVLDNLILSYEALEYEQQQIFLDIACLPIGNMHAFYMWDACGFYPKAGIEILVSLSLIKVRDHIIVMNDQLRYVGREIIRREGHNNIGLRSRLWLQEEAIKVIERKQGTPNIQALCLSTPRGNEIHFTSQQFEGMENLRFLHMGSGVHLTGDFENLFSNITWLSWCSESNYIDMMGFNFNPIKLVILELKRTNITEHWKGWNQIKNLRVLILERCNDLTTTPDFSAVEGLEELVLHDCYSLEKVHPSIGKFRKTLKVLAVQGCSKLEELPIEVGEMEELMVLRINGRTSWVTARNHPKQGSPRKHLRLEDVESLEILKIKRHRTLEKMTN